MRADRVRVSIGAAIFYPALYYFDSAGWFSAFVPAMLFHELGHILAIRACGGHIAGLCVDITGFCIETAALFSPRQEALCALAGPLAGLLWAGAAALAGLERHGALSLILSAFNLLPALPLDGGRLLLALTGRLSLVRRLGRGTAALLLTGALWGRHWGLLIPAVLVLGDELRA